MNVDNVLQC